MNNYKVVEVASEDSDCKHENWTVNSDTLMGYFSCIDCGKQVPWGQAVRALGLPDIALSTIIRRAFQLKEQK